MLPRSSSTASVDHNPDLEIMITDSDLDELQSSPSNSPLIYVPPPCSGPASTIQDGGDANASAGPGGGAPAQEAGDGDLTKFQMNALDVLHQLCALDDLYLKLISTMDELPRPPDRATRKILLDREDLLINPRTGVKAKRGDRSEDLERMISKIHLAQKDVEGNLIPDRLLRRLQKHYVTLINNRDIVLGVSTAVKNQIGVFFAQSDRYTTGGATKGPSGVGIGGRNAGPSIAGLGFCCFTFPRGVNDVDAQGFNDDLTFEYTYQGKQRLIVGLGIARVINHSCRANVEWPFVNPLDFKTGIRGIGYMTAKLNRLAPLRAGDELFGFYGEKFARLDCKCEPSRYHPANPQSDLQPQPQPQTRSHAPEAITQSLFGHCATPGPSSRPAIPIPNMHAVSDDTGQVNSFETQSPTPVSGFESRPLGDESRSRKRVSTAEGERASVGKRRKMDYAFAWENAEEDEYEFGQETDDDYTPEDQDDDDDDPAFSLRSETRCSTRMPTSATQSSLRRVASTTRARGRSRTEEDELESNDEEKPASIVIAEEPGHQSRESIDRRSVVSAVDAPRDVNDMLKHSQELLERMGNQLRAQMDQLETLRATMDTLVTSNGVLQQAMRDQQEMQTRILEAVDRRDRSDT
ncbi:hypothetical protein IAT40_005580 [Kwoniella sp. CBS 6097]